jgi:ABC-type multidrug transport system fused ATPase/permease subunit
LDAKAETELFKHYQQLVQDKLTLLITHRFNTVKMANRILVLEQGQVIEDGSHSELLRLHRRYAEMFEAQASGYRD